MKILIDENLKGAELTKFLTDNYDEIILQKKSMLKRTDPVLAIPSLYVVAGDRVSKAVSANISPDATSVLVKVVANTALFMDSQSDVLLPDCWKVSIKQRKNMIPHLHDHVHEIGAEVGDVQDIYSQDISLTDLGLNKQGKTQCLIFETNIQKSYNEKVFNKYKAGKINQHSIGLNYVKIDMAIGDEENASAKAFELWNKYINQIINKAYAEEKGYFFVVSEIKLLENSCVLFGSNELTPTLDVKVDTLFQSDKSTEEQPLPPAVVKTMTQKIKETKFIN